MKHFLTILLASSLLFSCQQSMKDRLIGSWQNTTLDVRINLAEDKDSLIHIEEGQWETVLKIKPIVTRYTADGVFVSDYYSPEGKSMGSELGKWQIRNDSLILSSNNYKTVYKVTFEGNKAHFTSILDWDQDGDFDDYYDGWQEKMKD